MNCQEFESLVVDLVRGEIADSGLGTQCWAHAAGCVRCAEVLLAHEKLTAGLEILASQTEEIPVPERIEGALRKAFRARAADAGQRAERLTFPANPARPVGVGGSRLAWAMAAAAILVIAFAARVWKLRPGSEPVSMAQNRAPAQSERISEASGPGAAAHSPAAVGSSRAPSARKALPPPSKSARGRKSNSKPRPSNPIRQNPNDVMASDFIPLPYGSGLPLDDGWAMIRVTMPKSELASLGVSVVPLTSEQASTETLKADVVLGQDGLARAIRFVQ